MSLKLKEISFLVTLVILFFNQTFANQIIFEKIESNNTLNSGQYISEIGDEDNLSFLDLFEKKNFFDIQNLILIMPTKSSNQVVQDLIFEILTSKKKLTKK